MEPSPAAMARSGSLDLETCVDDDVLSWFLLNAEMGTASDDMLSSLMSSANDIEPHNVAFTEGSVSSNAGTVRSIAGNLSEESNSEDSSQVDNKRDSTNDPPPKKRKAVDSARSRESAKENRKRQRLRLDALSSRVKALTEENEGLKAHIMNVTQRKAEVQKHRMDMERMMAKKVLEKSYRDEPENQEELQNLVQNFRDMYADYGAYRHKEVCAICIFPTPLYFFGDFISRNCNLNRLPIIFNKLKSYYYLHE